MFDDLALKTHLTAQRLDTGSLLLDGPGVFVPAGARLPRRLCNGDRTREHAALASAFAEGVSTASVASISSLHGLGAGGGTV